MSAGYYTHKPSAEKESVERWENEGGRLGQNHYYLLDSIDKDHRRHKDQGVQTEDSKLEMRAAGMRFEL